MNKFLAGRPLRMVPVTRQRAHASEQILQGIFVVRCETDLLGFPLALMWRAKMTCHTEIPTEISLSAEILLHFQFGEVL